MVVKVYQVANVAYICFIACRIFHGWRIYCIHRKDVKKEAAENINRQPLISKFDCVYLRISGRNIFDPSGSTVKVAVVKSDCSSGSVAVKVMVSEPVQSGG